MFEHLQIYDPRERWLVGLSDWALLPLAGFRRISRSPASPVRRILLLRLERIGDLLMVLDAVAIAREIWPDAAIDLAVGSWNASLAKLIPGVDRVLTLDVPWLTRGEAGASWPTLVGTARSWRANKYDLVINFEPDPRSNFLAWLTSAPRRVGYWTGGGGAWLTDSAAYAPGDHVSINAMRAVARAAGVEVTAASPAGGARLAVPDSARAQAAALLGTSRGPWIGVHASGGRPSKQWHLDRFAETARRLARERHATIVLTGSAGDRELVDAMKARLTDTPIVDVAGRADLPTLAGLLASLDLLVTGDTGPMHLAAAVGTPLVALFGPSDPRRYGPLSSLQRVIRIDLPCSPCGQVRLPPVRCRGHVPDCLDGISVDVVVDAARDVLSRAATARAAAAIA